MKFVTLISALFLSVSVTTQALVRTEESNTVTYPVGTQHSQLPSHIQRMLGVGHEDYDYYQKCMECVCPTPSSGKGKAGKADESRRHRNLATDRHCECIDLCVEHPVPAPVAYPWSEDSPSGSSKSSSGKGSGSRSSSGKGSGSSSGKGSKSSSGKGSSKSKSSSGKGSKKGSKKSSSSDDSCDNDDYCFDCYFKEDKCFCYQNGKCWYGPDEEESGSKTGKAGKGGSKSGKSGSSSKGKSPEGCDCDCDPEDYCDESEDEDCYATCICDCEYGGVTSSKPTSGKTPSGKTSSGKTSSAKTSSGKTSGPKSSKGTTGSLKSPASLDEEEDEESEEESESSKGSVKVSSKSSPKSASSDDLGDLVDTAAAAALDLLVAALTATGLDDVLRTDGPFTVFAPTSDAFLALGDLLNELLLPENLPLLTDILLYHVVRGVIIRSDDIDDNDAVRTALGEIVEFIVRDDGDIFIEDATDVDALVLVPDVLASNGIAHVINKVLIFPGISLPGDSDSRSKSSKGPRGSSKSNKSPSSKASPSSKSSGSKSSKSPSSKVSPSSKASPSSKVSPSSKASPSSKSSGSRSPKSSSKGSSDDDLVDLVDTAAAASLDLLIAALEATGLDATLRTTGPFTVFAPTSEAFLALGDLLTELLLPENIPLLADILLYHVVPGVEILTDDIDDNDVVRTALGATVSFIVRDNGDIFVEDATDVDAFILVPDVRASNGVAHVIDKVLIFPDISLPGDSDSKSKSSKSSSTSSSKSPKSPKSRRQ